MAADFAPIVNWPVRWPCDVSTTSPVLTGTAVASATMILWSMSGQRYGLTSVKLRPCRRTCRQTSWPGYAADPWPGPPIPMTPWGALIGAECSGCGDSCSCTSLSDIVLPGLVNTVTEVRQDGAVLASSAYRLDNNRLLLRTDGNTWPYCQNLRLLDTQPGTFSVTASYGEDMSAPVQALAEIAVGEVACQYLRAVAGEDCRLPPNMTSLARQGVSITLPDMSAVLHDKGLLGLPWADRFINMVNPAGLRQQPKTYNVDEMLARRTGT